ncbi:MAG: phosphoglyceromutase [Pseudomonadota bacterium]
MKYCNWVLFWSLLGSLVSTPVQAQESAAATNVILVTLDGVRWQEVFHGLDQQLAADKEFNTLGDALVKQFGAETPALSAAKLFPFLHEVIAKQGTLIGNRAAQSCARVTNPWFFSYPGYNEILTGVVDPAINTNEAKPNPNVSFLEWLNKDVASFKGKVLAFGSWDAFPAILNSARSGIPVEVGQNGNSAEAATLKRLAADLPVLWASMRYDAFTHHGALKALREDKPRALYVAYGETDDFAHDGRYEQHLLAANRTDRFLRELWETVQSDPQYRDNTVLFITTDHGRGNAPIETWQHHASKESLAGYMKSLAAYKEGIVGSDAVWMAAIGAGVPARGPVATASCVGSNQIAGTLLQLLGLESKQFNAKAGAPMTEFLSGK